MDQIKRLAGSLSSRQILTIALVAAVAAGGIYGFARWQQESSFRPLYSSLSQDDANIVVQKLKESGTPYRLSADGANILAPEDKIAELRLEMAGAGVPKNGRIGFEIFDKTNFGMTDFAEHVNYRRALEGELERSVMSVAEVEQARVHISLPQESVFLEARQPAKASVLVKIRAGATLPDSAIPAITNLIASAVEGLAPEGVSVLDMRGNLLNRPKRMGGAGNDLSESALEYQHKVEQDLTTKLDSTLEPLVGAGRFRAAVSAECDMNSGEQSEESFDPTRSVMVSSQKTEDVSSQARVAAGVPGTGSNLPDSAPRPPAAGGGTSRKTENVSYQTSRTVKRTILPQGAIKKLSVSVLIDHEVHFEGSGAAAKRVLAAPTPERLKVIHDLVAAAAGINPQRGDQLIVESLPFESTLNLDPPGAATPLPAPKKLTALEQLKSDPKLLIGGAAILLAILGGGFFLIRMMGRSKGSVEVNAAQSIPAPAPAETAALPRPARSPEPDTWSPAMSPGLSTGVVPALTPGRVEVLTNQLRGAAQKDAEVCAGVMRGWLKQERA